MALLKAEDLVPLGRLFSSNIDDADFVGKMTNMNTKLDAVRREREALESASRRRHEMDVHLGRLKRLGIERRLSEIAKPPAKAGTSSSGNDDASASAAAAASSAAAAAAAARAAEAAEALERARRSFADAAQAAAPGLRDARQHAHAAALAKVRDELSDVEVRRGRAQQEFAEELKAQAELAREKQRLQMARRLARGEGDAHAALRSSLFLSEGGVANEASPPANVPPTAWSAAVQAAAQATGVAAGAVNSSTPDAGIAPLTSMGALVSAALQGPGGAAAAVGGAAGIALPAAAQVVPTSAGADAAAVTPSVIPGETSISIEQQGGTCNVYLAGGGGAAAGAAPEGGVEAPSAAVPVSSGTGGGGTGLGAAGGMHSAGLGALLGGGMAGGMGPLLAAGGAGGVDMAALQSLIQLQALQTMHACMVSCGAAAPLSSQSPTTTNSSHVVGAGGAPSHHQGASQVPTESGSGVSTAHSRLPAPAPAASCVSPAGLSTRPRTALVAGSNAFAPATPESRRQPSAALAPVTAASAANASSSSAAQQAARDAPVEASSPSASSSSQQPQQQQQQQQQLQQQGRVELRGKPQRMVSPTARPVSPRDRSRSPASFAGRASPGDASRSSPAAEESFDADEMESMLHSVQSERQQQKAAAEKAARMAESARNAASAVTPKGDERAPWKVRPVVDVSPKQQRPAPAPSAKSPSPSEAASVLGLAQALQSKGEAWGRREAESAAQTWRTLSSTMPPNEHQRALDLWRSDPTHGLRALSAAQCVSALRALVKSRPSPLFPASFLEEEAPSVDSLRATLSGTDFDLFRVLVRHLHALAKSASLSRPAQCTILAPTLLPPATGPKAQDYSRAAARFLDAHLPASGAPLPAWVTGEAAATTADAPAAGPAASTGSALASTVPATFAPPAKVPATEPRKSAASSRINPFGVTNSPGRQAPHSATKSSASGGISASSSVACSPGGGGAGRRGGRA